MRMISGQWFMRRFFKEVTEIVKNYPRNIHTNLKQICAAFWEKNVKKNVKKFMTTTMITIVTLIQCD